MLSKILMATILLAVLTSTIFAAFSISARKVETLTHVSPIFTKKDGSESLDRFLLHGTFYSLQTNRIFSYSCNAQSNIENLHGKPRDYVVTAKSYEEPKVLFDYFHGWLDSSPLPPEYIKNPYNFTQDIDDFYGIRASFLMTNITFDELRKFDVVVPCWPINYTDSEAEAIVRFVSEGGGLFLIGEQYRHQNDAEYSHIWQIIQTLNKVSKNFGIFFCWNHVLDSSDNMGNDWSRPQITQLADHPIATNVRSFTICGGVTLETEGEAIPLAWGSPSSWADENHNSQRDLGEKVGNDVVIVAAACHGKGRVVAIGDECLLTSKDTVESGDGKRLILNILEWLSEPQVSLDEPVANVVGEGLIFSGRYVHFKVPLWYANTARSHNVTHITDEAYELLRSMTGEVPYNGEPIVIAFSPITDPGYAFAGNPILAGRWFWGEVPAWGMYFHELGHDFTWGIPKFNLLIRYRGFAEGFASLSSSYVYYHLIVNCISVLDSRFKVDPDDMGVSLRYYQPDFNDSDWTWASPGDFWENQGYPDYDGFAWYRMWFNASKVSEGKDVWVWFGGIDDDAWIYVNGHFVTERKGVFKPIALNVTDFVRPGLNLIAVRARDVGGTGGIYRGVLVLPFESLKVVLFLNDDIVAGGEARAAFELRKYEKAAAPFDKAWQVEVEYEVDQLAFGILLRLKEMYGWTMYEELFRLGEHGSPKGQHEALDLFVYSLSRAARHDLAPIFRSWGFPVRYFVTIDDVYVSSKRADVKSTQTVAFHMIWSINMSNVAGAILEVNGTRYVTNATGWAALTASWHSEKVGKQVWVVSDVYDYNLISSVEPPSVIWDRIEMSCSLLNIVPGAARLIVSLRYSYDDMPVDDAEVFIAGVKAVNNGDGTYACTMSNWSPFLSVDAEIDRSSFDSIDVGIEGFLLANLITLVIIPIISGVSAAFLVLKRRLKRHWNMNFNDSVYSSRIRGQFFNLY